MKYKNEKRLYWVITKYFDKKNKKHFQIHQAFNIERYDMIFDNERWAIEYLLKRYNYKIKK